MAYELNRFDLSREDLKACPDALRALDAGLAFTVTVEHSEGWTWGDLGDFWGSLAWPDRWERVPASIQGDDGEPAEGWEALSGPSKSEPVVYWRPPTGLDAPASPGDLDALRAWVQGVLDGEVQVTDVTVEASLEGEVLASDLTGMVEVGDFGEDEGTPRTVVLDFVDKVALEAVETLTARTAKARAVLEAL